MINRGTPCSCSSDKISNSLHTCLNKRTAIL
uniref:Uncharacterized protein n=1 Tax=Anguilla anguilla TaxID=7936 RepID=A0A0E9SBU8_ANGAN